MTYNLKNLNVASLDFDNIVSSLTSFLEVQPGLTDIAFRDKGTMANRLINVLATATAYNGIYAQFGYTETAMSTATLVESVVGIASNHSVLVPITQSAQALAVTRAELTDYQIFTAKATDGSSVNFYNVNGLSGSSVASEITLYSGSNVVTFTNYDFDSQSMLLPLNIDPNTISFYVADNANSLSTATKWVKVSKTNQTPSSGNQYYTVIHSGNGYLVTNNFANSSSVSSEKSVFVKAVVSNGTAANNAIISDPSNYFDLLYTASGGYNRLTVDTAKAKMLFDLNYGRCVALKDFKNAIVGSGIPGTGTESLVSVRNGDVPGTVNVYVTGLGSVNQSLLMDYLQPKVLAGMQVIYGQ